MSIAAALEKPLRSVGATSLSPERMPLLRGSSTYYAHAYKHFGLLSECVMTTGTAPSRPARRGGLPRRAHSPAV